MQVTFNKRNILPTAYAKKPDKNGNPQGNGYNTTIFSPVQYGIRFGSGMMPVEQMKVVLETAAENAEEVEVEFTEGRNSFGSFLEIYSVKPLPKTKTANAPTPTT